MATLVLGTVVGCGTTRWTDTARTATEQLLISDAMDRAVSRLDLRALAGRTVYLDTAPLDQVIDHPYLVSTLRQHMLASGCILKDKREEADYVVEARAGAVGTDKREIMFGVPAVNVPAGVSVPVAPPTIPEIPFVKKTEQRGVTKIALFAYNTKTGRPVWQSGTVPVESTAKDIWVLGAGPFQRGSIYGGTKLAGSSLDIPLVADGDSEADTGDVAVADEAFFTESTAKKAQRKSPGEANAVAATPTNPPATAVPTGAAAPGAAPPANPPAGGQDQQVIPAAHYSEAGNPTPSPAGAANQLIPGPVDESQDPLPRQLIAPPGAEPLPVQPVPGSSRVPATDPSLIFDP